MSLADLADLLIQPDWFRHAACRNVDSTIFFPAKSGGNRSGAKAKAICATCPVQEPCLDYALAFSSFWDQGIYAGTNANQRRELRRKRRAA